MPEPAKPFIPPQTQWYQWMDRFTSIDELLRQTNQILNEIKDNQITPAASPPPIVSPPPNYPITFDQKMDQLIDLSTNIRGSTMWGLPRWGEWNWLADKIYNMVIPANSKKRIWERNDENGYMTSLILTVSSPYITAHVKLDMAEWVASPYNSFNAGFKDIGFGGVNVIQYDTIQNIFTMYYMPNSPGDPYKNSSFIELENPTSSDITIYYGEMNRIVMKKVL